MLRRQLGQTPLGASSGNGDWHCGHVLASDMAKIPCKSPLHTWTHAFFYTKFRRPLQVLRVTFRLLEACPARHHLISHSGSAFFSSSMPA
jgi:hypothetical protein